MRSPLRSIPPVSIPVLSLPILSDGVEDRSVVLETQSQGGCHHLGVWDVVLLGDLHMQLPSKPRLLVTAPS